MQKMNHFPSNVKLLSTQRFIEGGKSSNNFENFNLALHVNDNSDRVLENRKMLKNVYKLPSKPQWINQVHLEGWKQGIKTYYYLRTDSVIKGDLGSRMADCVSCDG